MIYTISIQNNIEKDNKIIELCESKIDKRSLIICRTCDLAKIYMKLRYKLKNVSIIQYRYKWKYHSEDWNKFLDMNNNVLITDKLNLKVNNIDINQVIYYCKTIKCNIKSNDVYYFSEEDNTPF